MNDKKRVDELEQLIAMALNMLPMALSKNELAVVIMTIVDWHVGKDSKAGIGVFLTAVVTFAQDRGYRNEDIARILYETAAAAPQSDDGDTVH